MTEYDYSPEAYERYMATQTRISNWIDTVSQSTHTPSPSSRHSHSSDYHHRSRSRTSHSQPQSQSHSRSNSLSRTHSRGHHPQQRDYSRPRSYSQSGSRPQASRSHTSPPPVHSRTYSYAINQIQPPAPMPPPQPIPYSQQVPRRSRTLPPQMQNVVYHTYDAPRGGPTYVIVPPAVGGSPQQVQVRVQSPVTPTKRQQPLLKRLLTSLGPWGSSSGASPKAKSTPPRRHRRTSSL